MVENSQLFVGSTWFRQESGLTYGGCSKSRHDVLLYMTHSCVSQLSTWLQFSVDFYLGFAHLSLQKFSLIVVSVNTNQAS